MGVLMMGLNYYEEVMNRRTFGMLCVTIAVVLLSFVLNYSSRAEEILKPDKGSSVIYENPTLENISQYSPELANELSILPEFKEGISDKQNKSLENILGLISDDKYNVKVRNKLDYILKEIGGPKKKYNSVIEAIQWMAEDTDVEGLKKGIPWDSPNDTVVATILTRTWGDCRGPKWQTWKGQVRERLNELVLIEYFLASSGYNYIPDPGPKGKVFFPQQFLERGGGDCEDIAGIQEEAAEKAGYPSYLIHLFFEGRSARNNHTIAITRWKDGKLYTIPKSFSDAPNRLVGPFDKQEDLIKQFEAWTELKVYKTVRFEDLIEYKGAGYW
jgi:hypothetical protein